MHLAPLGLIYLHSAVQSFLSCPCVSPEVGHSESWYVDAVHHLHNLGLFVSGKDQSAQENGNYCCYPKS